MKLDIKLGEKPLWSQLYDILEDRILTGYYPTGTNLPSEVKIMEEFEVSRITVGQAMDKLINSGLIARKRGKGTIVLKKNDKIETAFQSYFNGIYEKNNDTDRRVISFKKVTAPIEVAYFFNMREKVEVWRLVREIWVDNKPVAHFETYLDPKIEFDENDNMEGSLYKKLQSLNYEITHVVENVTAALSTPEDKKIFMLKKTAAIVRRIRKGYSKELPVEYTFSRYISDGYELTINLQ